MLDPEVRARLEAEDPDHLAKIEDGWSWIELWGGPQDGVRCYHVGPPYFSLRFLDWSCKPKDYIKGVHPIHVYELTPCTDGKAIYRWQGVTK